MGEGTAGRSRGRARQTRPGPELPQAGGENGAGGEDSLTLCAGRSGEWMEALELRRRATEELEAHSQLREVVIDVGGLEHLDASALQVLVAIRGELRGRKGRLRLEHASEGLRRWFRYAGAEDLVAASQGAERAGKESHGCDGC